MKVISIKEPFASLIMNGSKKIETRSWKTNYRGELYIHASGKKIAKEYVDNPYIWSSLKEMKMNYGNIICKGNIVDCIYMDEEFLEKIKNDHPEYECGHYEIGRYAWVLDDIEIIDPIPAKGKLSIWNYTK